MSVSDIVVLNRDGEVSAKYVDAFGFTDVPEFLEQKELREKKVSLYVAECSEFHSLGEYQEGIDDVTKAIGIFNEIPAARMNGIKAIGIVLEDEKNPVNNREFDIVVGNHIDLDMLSYVPEVKDSEVCQNMIAQIIV